MSVRKFEMAFTKCSNWSENTGFKLNVVSALILIHISYNVSSVV